MRTIRRRAIIKALGKTYGVKMKYSKMVDKRKPKMYIITIDDEALDNHIIADHIRVLRWDNLYPYIKDVLKAYKYRAF